MFAKNITVAIVLLSLLGFSNHTAADTRIPLSATGGLRDHSTNRFTSVLEGMVYMLNSFNHSLNYVDQQTHTKAMIFAAENLDNGEITEWDNPSNGTAGKIRVMLTRPVQGGVCRLMFVQVEMRNNIRDYSEYACKTIDSQFWTFSLR
jgi:hypothetical protein